MIQDGKPMNHKSDKQICFTFELFMESNTLDSNFITIIKEILNKSLTGSLNFLIFILKGCLIFITIIYYVRLL